MSSVVEALKKVMAAKKALATSGSLEGIKKLITEFYMGSNVTLNPISDKEWEVHTGKGLLDAVRVIKKGGRFRFEFKD